MGDLISREALLEEMKCYQMDIVSKATAMRVIRNAPSVTDTNVGGKWIPCSEMLPDDDRDVLVWFEYYRFGDYNRLYQTIGISSTFHGKWSGFVNGTSGWQKLRIIAWMPLPEEYQEGE